MNEVVKATPEDLVATLGWLKREHDEDGEGFWCNRRIIERAQGRDLWVIRCDGEAVAFQVGDYAADIVSVRKDHRRRGLGDALFAASLHRARNDNINVLSIECTPRLSWAFWKRHEFVRFGDMSEFGRITARRVLARSFDLPEYLPSVNVVVGFYAEDALYDPGSVPPIAQHHLRGVKIGNNAILLERRVIELCDAVPDGRDLAVRIDIDGALRCFSKAKYKLAEEAGVIRDWIGDAFYLDEVQPSKALARD